MYGGKIHGELTSLCYNAVTDRNSATDKLALLIGNNNYKKRALKCPRNDVQAMADKLRELGFKVISLVDLTLNEMQRAVEFFCNFLDKGMYAVFYYSGHGLEHCKTSYLVPIDAINFMIMECINYDHIRQKLQKKLSKVIVVLDCCRKM